MVRIGHKWSGTVIGAEGVRFGHRVTGVNDQDPGGLDAAAIEVLGGSVGHWVAHMFGTEVYELYTADLQAMHGRLHEELLDLLPQAPDASLWATISLEPYNTSVECSAHPQYIAVPPTDVDGCWRASVRIHRHEDGSPGVEADDDTVCSLLTALASHGGFVTVSVHPPLASAALLAPEAPAAVGASWRVESVGAGLPQLERPTVLASEGGPMDTRASALRMAVDMTPPAGGPSAVWKAITGSLWDGPGAHDTEAWRTADPQGFLLGLEEAVERLERLPELRHPLALAAGVAHLRNCESIAEGQGDAYTRAVIAAAAAHMAGEFSLFDCARKLAKTGSVEPAQFAHEAVGFVAYLWQNMMGGILLLPAPDDAAKADALMRLRALIGRELGRG